MQHGDDQGTTGTTSLTIAAKLLEVSEATVRRMVSAGRTPQPIRVGEKGIRFDSQEFDAWLAAGAPNRAQWQKLWLHREGFVFRCSCGKRWRSSTIWKFISSALADLVGGQLAGCHSSQAPLEVESEFRNGQLT